MYVSILILYGNIIIANDNYFITKNNIPSARLYLLSRTIIEHNKWYKKIRLQQRDNSKHE